MKYTRNITIRWSYPRLLKDIDTNPEAENRGIYQITYKHRDGSESLVYIGRTSKQYFEKRMKQHFKKGKFPANSKHYYVRLASIDCDTPLTKLTPEECELFIDDVESALILGTIEHWKQKDASVLKKMPQ